LRVFSHFLSGESPALAKPPASKITAKAEAIILNFIGMPPDHRGVDRVARQTF
jgi:hypothetical protein